LELYDRSNRVDLELVPGLVIKTCSRLWECGVVLAGVKAEAAAPPGDLAG
jgi:hypothetical protein